ncbi:uncharacterized protein LOC111262125 [Varroa jacobsoni]|uniref:uncharacterized protein LOC111262125 n=1 Tax=Varroa jacobsoni TaxID=62625 RepID=UPI000BFA11BD|nr:uncharacterized protein LOC111262125 [Varroa jacobsoni]
MKTDLLGLLIDDSGRDPRFIGYPFVDSPKYILAISAAYLAFIFYIGPRFMRDRKPLPIKPLIRIFNTYQIIANISVVCSMSYLAFYKLRYSIICEPPDAKMDIDSLRLHRIGYYYLYVRLSDYFDTVFFVLAKKQSHVTFLHVYHHLCVCLNGWLYMRQGWANIGALGGLINASIHTIMYIYFLLATFPTMRRHLWWKKHLTLLQMAQFIAMISQFVIVYSQHDHCGYPKGVLINGIINVLIIFLLFVAFYIKTYLRSEGKITKVQYTSIVTILGHLVHEGGCVIMKNDLLSLILDENGRDPRFIGYPFYDSPKYLLGISAVYLAFVYYIGPRFMRNRKPVHVKPYIRIFNAFQIFANILYVGMTTYLAYYKLNFSVVCEPPNIKTDTDSLRLQKVGYYYLYVRLSDYLDTMFFVLAKKQSHVTFLHVFHHLTVCCNCWLYMRQGWMNMVTLAYLVNAAIHIVMYSYFLLATFPSMRPYLWWKKYLTLLQIMQFVAVISQWMVAYSQPNNCGYSKGVLINGMINVFILLALFVAFYVKTYLRQERKAIKAQ